MRVRHDDMHCVLVQALMLIKLLAKATYHVQEHGHVTQQHLPLIIVQQREADDIARFVGDEHLLAAPCECQPRGASKQHPVNTWTEQIY